MRGLRHGLRGMPRHPSTAHSFEAWQVWDPALRRTGPLRAIPGGVLGWDFAAALALGVPAHITAELLPAIEPVAIRALNPALKTDSSPETPAISASGSRCATASP